MILFKDRPDSNDIISSVFSDELELHSIHYVGSRQRPGADLGHIQY